MLKLTPLVLFSVLSTVAAGVFILAPSTADAECHPEATILPMAPLELAALFDIECARTVVDERGAEGTTLAIDLGYPSLLFGREPDATVIELLEATAQEGDRGFFSADPDIAEILLARPDASNHRELISFVLSAHRSEQRVDPMDISIWSDPKAAEALVMLCAEKGCQSPSAPCPELSMEDKLAVAKGKLALSDLIAQCEITPAWAVALRRAGVVDTRCTSTLQVSEAFADPTTLEGPCIGFGLDPARAFTPADLFRSVREALTSGEKLDVTTRARLAEILPSAAAYLEKRSGG